MKSPVFLTGATGFLGMEVLARLLEKGDREVIALVRAAGDGVRRDESPDGGEPAAGPVHGVHGKRSMNPVLERAPVP